MAKNAIGVTPSKETTINLQLTILKSPFPLDPTRKTGLLESEIND